MRILQWTVSVCVVILREHFNELFVVLCIYNDADNVDDTAYDPPINQEAAYELSLGRGRFEPVGCNVPLVFEAEGVEVPNGVVGNGVDVDDDEEFEDGMVEVVVEEECDEEDDDDEEGGRGEGEIAGAFSMGALWIGTRKEILERGTLAH